MSDGHRFRVNDRAAHAYRLQQAEALLRECGFVPDGKGGWHPADVHADEGDREHEDGEAR